MKNEKKNTKKKNGKIDERKKRKEGPTRYPQRRLNNFFLKEMLLRNLEAIKSDFLRKKEKKRKRK